jgi:glycosyltransferase involved in cell wall biosynthesis
VRIAIFDNLANTAYVQAKAFHRRGIPVDLVLNPLDMFAMSDPRWEDMDFEVPSDALARRQLPAIGDEPTWIRRGPGRPEAGVQTTIMDAAVGMLRTPRTTLRAARIGSVRGATIAALNRWTIKTLRSYDAVVASGTGAIFAALAGVPFLAQTWGGDITIMPFADAPPGRRGELPEPGQSARRPTRHDAAQARLLRWGLGQAHRILCADPRFLPFCDRLGLADRAVFMPLVVDTEGYSPGEEPALRAELLGPSGTVLAFVPSRLDFHWKGSDAMLRGVADAMAAVPGLVLASAGWGVDRDRTRALAVELGIADRIRFLPNALSKRRLLRHYRAADMVLDQFTVGSYGLSALEAMSTARPLLIHLDDTRFQPVFGTPPVVNVREPEAIGRELAALAVDPGARARVGSAQRAWVIEHHGAQLADRVRDLLADAVQARATGKP